MSLSALDDLSARHGIALVLDGFAGAQPVSDTTKLRILSALGLDARSPEAIAAALGDTERIAPPILRAPEAQRCHLPAWLEKGRAWGISVQLYELRSRRNWGIGDFADLARMCRVAALAGAEFLGVSPLHALFVAKPSRCSPFSPSNRRFLNPLYIAVDQIPGAAPDAADLEEAASLRETEMVDYGRVAALKLRALRRIWQAWGRDVPAAPWSGVELAAFKARGGAALRLHALFEALSVHFAGADATGGWSAWPEPYRDAGGVAVKAFAKKHAADIDFHVWLQWVARTQLHAAAEAARAAGMRVGLYLDFAVGEVLDGSATWSNPEMIAPGMSIGAPPDMFTANGQEWGLAPLSPRAMVETGAAAYRQTIEAMMAEAGALRIDHAMSLWQLFFVPEGGVPADGAFVRYPIEELLTIVAERSRADRTIVIGEDLGYVPPGFREVMRAANILSYRILYFEKHGETFTHPHDYPRLALACLSTHDMPTLRGWWMGDDVGLRRDNGLIDDAAAEHQREERSIERRALIDVLEASHLLAPEDVLVARAAAADPASALPAAVVVAAHRLIARTPCLLACARLADLTGEDRPTNLPGTIDAYPNWRLKSSLAIEDLPKEDLFRSIAGALADERPKTR